MIRYSTSIKIVINHGIEPFAVAPRPKIFLRAVLTIYFIDLTETSVDRRRATCALVFRRAAGAGRGHSRGPVPNPPSIVRRNLAGKIIGNGPPLPPLLLSLSSY